MSLVSMRTNLVIGLMFVFLAVPVAPTYGGFGNFLKDVQKAIGGKKPLSEAEIIQGLKEALRIGTAKAIEKVSKVNGYYGNAKIRIPLPSNIQRVEKLLRTGGYGEKLQAFELSMNRAAERAAPQAKTIFVDAAKQMSFSDARKILKGRENEATLYFKGKTSSTLHKMFKPIVHNAMSQVGVTRRYQDLDAKVRTIPFAKRLSLDLDQYVTERALDGLFLMLAEEEAKIRRDPKARVTDLLKRVFGKT